MFAFLSLALTLFLFACQPQQQTRLDWTMGERIALGPATYVVVSSSWTSQLGEGFNIRIPQNRFLLINVSVTNSGGEPISIPLLTIEDSSGRQHQELADGAGVSNWMGLIRDVTPAETKQGRILFDVPLTSYKLALPDPSDETMERQVYVDIPLDLQMDDVQAPIPEIQMQ